MAKRRARENPITTRNKVLIAAGGATLLGTILYFVTRPKETSKGETTKSQSTQNGGGGGTQPGGAVKAATSSVSYVPAPPPSNITNASSAFVPAVLRNTPNVSWVQGPNP